MLPPAIDLYGDLAADQNKTALTHRSKQTVGPL